MNVVQILIIVAVVALVIGRRLGGQPLQLKRLVVLPVVLCAIGLEGLTKAVQHPSPADVGLLALSLVVSLIFGLLRGFSVQVSVRDGYLWYRYRPSTMGWWAAAVASRAGLAAVEHAAGAGHALASSLMLGLAVTLLGEAAVVYHRSRALDAPFAGDGRGRSVGQRLGR
ncbi:MAG TPA: hypothetical protein VHX59_08395 [Mycobacteriales bacterium]|nr:hypothetical protein [Mycobacteriales bacterium]